MGTEISRLIEELKGRTKERAMGEVLVNTIQANWSSFLPIAESIERLIEEDSRYRRLLGFVSNFCDWSDQTGKFAPDAIDAPLYPEITWKPFYESSEFPWIPDMEARADAVRKELFALRGQGAFRAYQQPQSVELPVEGEWNTYNFHHSGHTFGENCRRCPETVKLLRSAPVCFSVPGIVKFSALSPGTHITAHRGFGNFKLRCHFTLTDASGCELRVASEVRRWENGKCLVFDDSLNHEVWHRGDRTRIVLLFDFWHPELSPGEVAVLKEFFAFFTKLHMMDGWKHSQMTMKPATEETRWWV